jgi:BirA family biotin operon repressor/biotin-[acetyl-CoA-carboxylase] ligase
VIGIGINLGQTAEDFPTELRETATSLFIETGKLFKRSDIISCFCEEFGKIYRSGRIEGHDKLIRQYKNDLCMLGKNIRILRSDGTERLGTALDIDENGGLITKLDDGSFTTLNSGEISIRSIP